MKRRNFLKTAGTGAAVAASAGIFPLSEPASLFAQTGNASRFPEFMVGVEYYFNNDVSFEEMDRMLRIMHEHNYTVIRIFLYWEHVNPQKGVWDFGLYDRLFKAAENNQIGVAPTFVGVESGARWHKKEYPDVPWGIYDDARLREIAEEFIRRTVEQYKNHPALYGWILENEPASRVSYHPLVMQKFRTWLKNIYGNDIKKLNQNWYDISIGANTYTSFDEIEITEETFTPRSWTNHSAYRDWMDYTIWRKTDLLVWIGKIVKWLDPDKPTNINPNGSCDRWDFAKSVDNIGMSLHPGHWFSRWQMSELPVMVNYQMDEVRSSLKKNPYWITELQGGPNIYSGSRSLTPRYYHIKQWIWNSRASNASCIIFWMWYTHFYHWEAGEWAMLDMRGKPSERMLAVQDAVNEMQRHEALLRNASRKPAKAAILFSKNNYLVGQREYMRTTNQDGPMRALMMCYRALWEANVQVDFINTEELESGAAKNYKVIYMPEMNHITKKSASELAEFVKGGGYLWADGIFGWKDDYGVVYMPAPGGGLIDVFGAEIIDVIGAEKPSDMIFAADREAVPSYDWEVWYNPTTGEPVASFESGNAAVVRNKFGAGIAQLVGTSLCRSLRENYNPRVAEYVAEFAIEALRNVEDWDLDIYYGKLLTRLMDGPRGPVIVVTNHGSEEGRGKLKVKNNYPRATELTTGAQTDTDAADGWSSIEIDVPGNDLRVFAFTE